MMDTSLKELESIPYTDVDINLCWKASDESDSSGTFITIPTCEENPKSS